jgi:hypothetical protein
MRNSSAAGAGVFRHAAETTAPASTSEDVRNLAVFMMAPSRFGRSANFCAQLARPFRR